MKNVSRRKYAALGKYLTSVMEDKQASQRSRAAAAFRLADVLLAHDERAWKLDDRAYRAEMRAAGQVVAEPIEVQAPESASEAAQRFLKTVGRGGSADE